MAGVVKGGLMMKPFSDLRSPPALFDGAPEKWNSSVDLLCTTQKRNENYSYKDKFLLRIMG